MKLLFPPEPRQEHYHLPSKERREFHALPATAINADEFPIIAKHWEGPLIISGRLGCNDNSPLALRFKTVPVRSVAQ